MSTTVFDVASTLYPLGTNVMVSRKKGIPIVTVTEGMKPRRAPRQPGLHEFTPEELLSLLLPYVSANGKIVGYQRPFIPTHARTIARAMLEGKPFPAIIVALDAKGNLSIVEGQHRAIGAVLAGRSITGHIQRLSPEEQRDLFAGQRRARPVDRNVLILAGQTPYERYIQDAVTQPTHPWAPIVSANLKSKTKVSPHTALALLSTYVANATESGSRLTAMTVERWDKSKADELAPLIRCFGDKKSNPLAFSHTNIRAISLTAMHVFRRRQTHADDPARWVKHMPAFQFADYVYIRRSTQMVDQLILHWNKRLGPDNPRRVERAA